MSFLNGVESKLKKLYFDVKKVDEQFNKLNDSNDSLQLDFEKLKVEKAKDFLRSLKKLKREHHLDTESYKYYKYLTHMREQESLYDRYFYH